MLRAAPPLSAAIVLRHHLPPVAYEDAPTELHQYVFRLWAFAHLRQIALWRRLEHDGVDARVTVCVSVSCLGVLADPMWCSAFTKWLGEPDPRGDNETDRRQRDDLSDLWARLEHDVPAEYGRLARANRIGLATTTFTSTPLAAWPGGSAINHVQLQAAVDTARRRFGVAPDGFWLGDDGVPGGADHSLVDAGVRYAVVTGARLLTAEAPARRGLLAPVRCGGGRLAVFGEASGLNTEGGPGDFDMRSATHGLDLSALTGCYRADPADVTIGCRAWHGPYDEAAARRAAIAHGAAWHAARARQLKHFTASLEISPTAVWAFDGALFGANWHEGPWCLEAVLRASDDLLRWTTPGRILDDTAALQVVRPSAGPLPPWSVVPWWLRRVHDAVDRLTAIAEATASAQSPNLRLFHQAVRELLLAQSGDWPAWMRDPARHDFGASCARDHLEAFNRLAGTLDDPHTAIDEDWLDARERATAWMPEIGPESLRPTHTSMTPRTVPPTPVAPSLRMS